MNRRALFGIGGAALLPLPVLAQDGTVPPEWEERIAIVEQRLDIIEARLGIGAHESVSTGATNSSTLGAITISGTGPTLSDPLQLDEGRYRVEVVVEEEAYFILHVLGPNNFEDYTFNEGPITAPISGSLEIPESGEYYAEIDNIDVGWTVVFIKL